VDENDLDSILVAINKAKLSYQEYPKGRDSHDLSKSPERYFPKLDVDKCHAVMIEIAKFVHLSLWKSTGSATVKSENWIDHVLPHYCSYGNVGLHLAHLSITKDHVVDYQALLNLDNLRVALNQLINPGKIQMIGDCFEAIRNADSRVAFHNRNPILDGFNKIGFSDYDDNMLNLIALRMYLVPFILYRKVHINKAEKDVSETSGSNRIAEPIVDPVNEGLDVRMPPTETVDQKTYRDDVQNKTYHRPGCINLLHYDFPIDIEWAEKFLEPCSSCMDSHGNSIIDENKYSIIPDESKFYLNNAQDNTYHKSDCAELLHFHHPVEQEWAAKQFEPCPKCVGESGTLTKKVGESGTGKVDVELSVIGDDSRVIFPLRRCAFFFI